VVIAPAYDRAVAFKDAPEEAHRILARAQLDERRHRDWMVATPTKLQLESLLTLRPAATVRHRPGGCARG
jgi:hypothetical protein